MDELLNSQETERLTACVAIIDSGLKTFIDVGNALMEIRDLRLYRQTHSTFEEFCRERWKLSRPRVYQLIDASEIARNLSTIVDTPTPTHESQLRPLSKLEPEQQREAWEIATKAFNGKPTAQQVQKLK